MANHAFTASAHDAILSHDPDQAALPEKSPLRIFVRSGQPTDSDGIPRGHAGVSLPAPSAKKCNRAALDCGSQLAAKNSLALSVNLPVKMVMEHAKILAA